ncbi:MAG: CPBP family glutamic-type intramembrane protease [Candidatus Bathyarchaeota archaeon]|nr:CPBP family glutamic-type intramembrane protease [Candidatus Bathyarchaeota archaeon]
MQKVNFGHFVITLCRIHGWCGDLDVIRLVVVLLTPFLFYKQTLEIINRVLKKRYRIYTPPPFDFFYYCTFNIILPFTFIALIEKDPFTFIGLKVTNQIEFQAALGLLAGALIAIFTTIPGTTRPTLGVSITINDNLKRLVKSFYYSFAEEFYWRGFIQSNLASFFPFPIFIVATAMTFGIFHLTDPSVRLRGIAMRMLDGAILGFLFFFTGNLISPFIAHTSSNVFARIPNLLFKRIRVYRTPPFIPSMDPKSCEKGFLSLKDYVKRGKHYIIIENSRLSTVVSPSDGGRIVYLYDKQTNHAKTYVGLLHDIIMEMGWPGFDKTSYDYEVINEKPPTIKLQHLISKGPLEGIKIIKTITLEEDKAAIKVDYTIHNIGDKERTVTLRVRGTFAISGKQLDTQYIVLPTMSGIKTMGYDLLSTKFVRKNNLEEGWVTILEKDTMEQVGMVWNPANVMALLTLCDYHAFSIELFFNSVTLKANEKSLPLTINICSGSGRALFTRRVFLLLHNRREVLK